jgi:hypothetical protein
MRNVQSQNHVDHLELQFQYDVLDSSAALITYITRILRGASAPMWSRPPSTGFAAPKPCVLQYHGNSPRASITLCAANVRATFGTLKVSLVTSMPLA